jgi:drug/metabolite transporter (DMT)-like permease
VGVDWRTIIGVVLYVALGVMGDVLLSRGMKRMPAFRGWRLSEAGRFFRHIGATREVLAGIGCLALNFATLLLLLTWADLSVVGPSRAASYLLLTLLASRVLHERVTTQRWIGVALISVGVTLTLLTSGTGGSAGP